MDGGDDSGIADAAVALVAPLHRLGLPVRPVDEVFEDGEGEDVVQPRGCSPVPFRMSTRVSEF